VGEKVVRDILVAASPVTALVPAARITPLVRPQAVAVPAITLSRISVVPFVHLRGSAQLDACRVQLDVWSAGYVEARTIADACRTALEGGGLLMNLEFDTHEPDTDPALARVTQEWSVFI
jgi:hypothetical protein